MRVVVTGGAGFIGANLVRALTASPLAPEVVVVDDLSTGRRENLDGLPVRLHVASILDADVLDMAIAGADAIVHLAAVPSVQRSIDDPARAHRVNATGTLEVLEAARRAGGPQVVVASSSSIYGDAAVSPKHEGLPPAPRSPYAASKLAAESYAHAYAACHGLPVLVLRFFNVFGPLQHAGHAYAAVIPAFVTAALDRRPIPMHGDGAQTRDFTFVGSVIRVLADALRRGVTHDGPVNCAFGSRRTVASVVDDLQALLGHGLEVAHLPPRVADVRHSQADTARLRRLFPDVDAVPFDVGLRETVAWLHDSHVALPQVLPEPGVPIAAAAR